MPVICRKIRPALQENHRHQCKEQRLRHSENPATELMERMVPHVWPFSGPYSGPPNSTHPTLQGFDALRPQFGLSRELLCVLQTSAVATPANFVAIATTMRAMGVPLRR